MGVFIKSKSASADRQHEEGAWGWMIPLRSLKAQHFLPYLYFIYVIKMYVR